MASWAGRGRAASLGARMNVKLQGLFNAAEFIEQRYGPQELAAVFQACSPQVRDRHATGIAIEWHPMGELVEFLRVADERLGTGDGEIAIEAGAAAARKNLRGAFTKALLWIARPDFLLKRIAALWSQFNDEGAMRATTVSDGLIEIEVTGVSTPDFLFCCVLTGWIREVGHSAGRPQARVSHVQCRGRGDARCLWRGEWEPLGEG
jgi:hypothetical protein